LVFGLHNTKYSKILIQKFYPNEESLSLLSFLCSGNCEFEVLSLVKDLLLQNNSSFHSTLIKNGGYNFFLLLFKKNESEEVRIKCIEIIFILFETSGNGDYNTLLLCLCEFARGSPLTKEIYQLLFQIAMGKLIVSISQGKIEVASDNYLLRSSKFFIHIYPLIRGNEDLIKQLLSDIKNITHMDNENYKLLSSELGWQRGLIDLYSLEFTFSLKHNLLDVLISFICYYFDNDLKLSPAIFTQFFLYLQLGYVKEVYDKDSYNSLLINFLNSLLVQMVNRSYSWSQTLYEEFIPNLILMTSEKTKVMI